MTTTPLALRSQAETTTGALPALLAAADQLASTVMLGDHGRRRAGTGDTFWQYRPAGQGDEARNIDWRRSARADTSFIADKEWQVAQSALFWIDNSAAMSFSSDPNLPTKSMRARTLGLAIAILLTRGGERIGLTSTQLPPSRGAGQLRKLAELLCETTGDEFGTPNGSTLLPHCKAVFIGDFLGDITATQTAIAEAATRGVKGCLLQVLDPQEVAFPFYGRTQFKSMGGGIIHETLSADGLQNQYLEKLAQRQDALMSLTRAAGWQFKIHQTDASAMSALLWLYQSLENGA